MAERTKGKCKYCGNEYAMGYMRKHLQSCKMRKERLAEETGDRQCGYFLLEIYGRYDSDYWLFAEVRETATLKDVDNFLRDIWLECCGHLSAFEIDGVSYESVPEGGDFWDEPTKSMNCKLKTVLKTGRKIGYEYDFGSTTELVISVVGFRMGIWKQEKVTLLSRNNPRQWVCSECGKKPAVVICAECMWEGEGFLCEDCAEDHECGEEMLLDICNSPRMGVCAYEGSEHYPDQFVPDMEKGADKENK